MNKLRYYQKHIVWILLFTMFFIPAITPILEVFAHDAYFIKSDINTIEVKYVTSIIEDKPGLSESSHIELELGNFSKTDANDDTSRGVNLMTTVKDPLGPFRDKTIQEAELPNKPAGSEDEPKEYHNEKMTEGAADQSMVYTFPSKGGGNGALGRFVNSFRKTNDATSEDAERANNIATELVGNLNQALLYINDGKRFREVRHLILASMIIRPEGNTNKSTQISGPNNTKYVVEYTTDLTKVTPEGNLLMTIKKTKNDIEEEIELIYAMPKGYMPTPIREFKGSNEGKLVDKHIIRPELPLADFAQESLGETDSKNLEDTAWLTIHHMAFQANYAYSIGESYNAGIPQEKESKVSAIIYELLSNILYGLLNILGLYDVEELIYNKGSKQLNSYEAGLMDSNWWQVVIRYHVIFQAIAWTLIIVAFVKILIQTNFSTVNPAIKMHLYEVLQKIMIVGVLLSSALPIIRLMSSMNNLIVDMFATQVDLSTSGRLTSYSGGISGIFVEFLYFAIYFYLNFIYIVRSIMIAILVATGPFFIVTMAFSYKGRGLFDGWLKELVANIFLQSFHAMAFAFIFNLQATSKGIYSIVSIAALIPLTEAFRGLIFQRAGESTIRTGARAGETAEGLTKSAGRAAIGGASAAMGAGIMGASGTEALKAGLNGTTGQGNSKVGRRSGTPNAGTTTESFGRQSGGEELRGAGYGGLTDAMATKMEGKANALNMEAIASGEAGSLKGGAFSAMAGVATAAGAVGQIGADMSDLSSGLVFDNKGKTAMAAQSLGKSVAGGAMGAGIAAAGAMGGAYSALSGSTPQQRAAKKREDALVSGASNRKYTQGRAVDAATTNAFGDSVYKMDNQKLADAGIEGMQTITDDYGNINGFAATIDAAKMDIFDDDGQLNDEGKALADMYDLVQTDPEKAEKEYGITGFHALDEEGNIVEPGHAGANGKFQIQGNNKFLANQGIKNIETTDRGAKTVMTKTPNSSAVTNFGVRPVDRRSEYTNSGEPNESVRQAYASYAQTRTIKSKADNSNQKVYNTQSPFARSENYMRNYSSSTNMPTGTQQTSYNSTRKGFDNSIIRPNLETDFNDDFVAKNINKSTTTNVNPTNINVDPMKSNSTSDLNKTQGTNLNNKPNINTGPNLNNKSDGDGPTGRI